MVFGKKKILEYIKDGKLVFSPAVDAFQIQPNSVDLRIGWTFYVSESAQYGEAGRVAVEPDYLTKGMNKDYVKMIKLKPGQYFELLPGELMLVSSLEKVDFTSGDFMGILHPRSSMVRRGFVIQGGVVDVKWSGHLVIPVLNSTAHALKLYPGERAYQLVLHQMTEDMAHEDALKHGVVSAKYASATPYNLEARTDSDDELEFIKRGDIEGLKKKFGVGQ